MVYDPPAEQAVELERAGRRRGRKRWGIVVPRTFTQYGGLDGNRQGVVAVHAQAPLTTASSAHETTASVARLMGASRRLTAIRPTAIGPPRSLIVSSIGSRSVYRSVPKP